MEQKEQADLKGQNIHDVDIIYFFKYFSVYIYLMHF